jgi:hypothetical protein
MQISCEPDKCRLDDKGHLPRAPLTSLARVHAMVWWSDLGVTPAEVCRLLLSLYEFYVPPVLWSIPPIGEVLLSSQQTPRPAPHVLAWHRRVYSNLGTPAPWRRTLNSNSYLRRFHHNNWHTASCPIAIRPHVVDPTTSVTGLAHSRTTCC